MTCRVGVNRFCINKYIGNIRHFSSNTLPEYPIPPKLRIRDVVFGCFWFGIFLTPFVYGQYSYKYRTGISNINFNVKHGKPYDISKEKKSQNYLREMMKTDEKLGS